MVEFCTEGSKILQEKKNLIKKDIIEVLNKYCVDFTFQENKKLVTVENFVDRMLLNDINLDKNIIKVQPEIIINTSNASVQTETDNRAINMIEVLFDK